MKIFLSLLYSTIVILTLWSCDTEPEAIVFDDGATNQSGIIRDEAYFENLRQFKKTMKDRPLTFTWFAKWTGNTQLSKQGSLTAFPDSLDIISIFNAYGRGEVPAFQVEEQEYVQNVLGTKVVMAMNFMDWNLGDGPWNEWGEDQNKWKNSDSMIRVYAKALVDTVLKYNLDGLDLDLEPHYGQIFYYPKNISTAVKEMSKYLGPKSGSGLLLSINGMLHIPADTIWEYVDYAISQAYAVRNYTGLQSKYNACAAGCPPNKFICTENFQLYAGSGGVDFRDQWGNNVQSYLGQAMWVPQQGEKAGCGWFFGDFDYNSAKPHMHLKEVIQLLNPASPNENITPVEPQNL